MVRKGCLDLTNSRFPLPECARVVDSLDFADLMRPKTNNGGATIAFHGSGRELPPVSAYREWKSGKIKGGGSGVAPLVDHHGNYIEVAMRCVLGTSPLKFSSREAREHDYKGNDAARIYYCRKQRIDTPAMNRVLDNTHEVPGETVQSRVERGLVPGGGWDATGREGAGKTNGIGPGHYNTQAFEAKYGPASSNLLAFLRGPSGRGVDEANRQPNKADRIRSRRLLSSAGAGEIVAGEERPRSSGMLGVASSLSAVGATSFAGGGDRWKAQIYRVEKYVKTTGAKLAPDYDVAKREREKVPHVFGTMPQRWEPKVDRPDVEIYVDCGHKMSLAKAAMHSPVKYSMAFRSKEPVGMHLPLPTSPPHLGPGAFPCKSSLEVKFPESPSLAFLAPRPTAFKPAPESAGSDIPMRPFSEVYTAGPTFSTEGTGAGLVLKIKMEHQLKTVYPRLAKKMFWKPKVVLKDPFAYLKPKKK